MRTFLFLILIVGSAAAQEPTRTFQYRVDGFYEGEAMEPWSATTTLSDSAGTLVIRHAATNNCRASVNAELPM